jgi:hypothetical protein
VAALTTLAVTNRAPKGVTLTFNAASVDLNATQLAQVYLALSKLTVECGSTMPTDGSVAITGI